MRKLNVLLFTLLIGTISMIVAVANNTLQKKTFNPQQATIELATTIDGAVNPSAISDPVAYELFLNSLTFRPEDGEIEQQRARSIAEQVGKDEEQVDALLAAAKSYKEKVSVLDQQVDEIKDRHWPNPSAAVMAELRTLQQQKENLISDTISSLTTKLNLNDTIKPKNKLYGDRLREHVNNRVKRKVKGFVPPPPLEHQHHGGMPQKMFGAILGFVGLGFVAPPMPAMQYMGEGYMYANTSIGGGQIYGYAATAQNYSSYGPHL